MSIGSAAKLLSLGFGNKYIHAKMQAEMFKVYIRPIILYSAENHFFDLTELKTLKRTEGNFLKRLLC